MDTLRGYVGDLLKRLRNTARLTQDQVGKRAGTDGKVIADYEAGRRNATLDTVDRILAAMGVTRYGAVLSAPKATPIKRDPVEEAIVKAVRRTERGLKPLTLTMARAIKTWSRKGRKAR